MPPKIWNKPPKVGKSTNLSLAQSNELGHTENTLAGLSYGLFFNRSVRQVLIKSG